MFSRETWSNLVSKAVALAPKTLHFFLRNYARAMYRLGVVVRYALETEDVSLRCQIFYAEAQKFARNNNPYMAFNCYMIFIRADIEGTYFADKDAYVKLADEIIKNYLALLVIAPDDNETKIEYVERLTRNLRYKAPDVYLQKYQENMQKGNFKQAELYVKHHVFCSPKSSSAHALRAQFEIQKHIAQRGSPNILFIVQKVFHELTFATWLINVGIDPAPKSHIKDYLFMLRDFCIQIGLAADSEQAHNKILALSQTDAEKNVINSEYITRMRVRVRELQQNNNKEVIQTIKAFIRVINRLETLPKPKKDDINEVKAEAVEEIKLEAVRKVRKAPRPAPEKKKLIREVQVKKDRKFARQQLRLLSRITSRPSYATASLVKLKPITLPPFGAECIYRLRKNQNANETRLKGGWLRQPIRSQLVQDQKTISVAPRKKKDADIGTDASGEQILKEFAPENVRANEHDPRLFHVFKDGLMYDIYSSAHLSNSYLDSKQKRKAEAMHANFTVNAFTADEKGEVEFELEESIIDLQQNVLRTVLPTAQAYSKDPILMLQHIYLSAQEGFTIIPEDRQIIRDKAHLLLARVKPGKLNAYLHKMFYSEGYVACIHDLIALDIFPKLFGPIKIDKTRLLDLVEDEKKQPHFSLTSIYYYFVDCIAFDKEEKQDRDSVIQRTPLLKLHFAYSEIMEKLSSLRREEVPPSAMDGWLNEMLWSNKNSVDFFALLVKSKAFATLFPGTESIIKEHRHALNELVQLMSQNDLPQSLDYLYTFLIVKLTEKSGAANAKQIITSNPIFKEKLQDAKRFSDCMYALLQLRKHGQGTFYLGKNPSPIWHTLSGVPNKFRDEYSLPGIKFHAKTM